LHVNRVSRYNVGHSMTRSNRSNWLLAAAMMAVAVLLAEILLRIAAPVADPTRSSAEHVSVLNPYIRFEYPRGYAAVTEVEPGLHGIEGRHFFTTNSYGFRGEPLASPKPAGEYRVFVVGGSTVECFYLDDADDMSRVAQRELADASAQRSIKVYNVGLSGTALDDHIAMIAQRLVHLEPDAIVVLAGINDLRRSIQHADYLHYAPNPSPSPPLYRIILMKSQIARRLAYLARRIDPDPERVLETRTLESDYADKIALQRAAPAAENSELQVDTAGFRRNLITLAGMARSHGFVLVLGTQPSSWNSTVDSTIRNYHWMRLYDGVVYDEAAMDTALEALNDVTRAVAQEYSLPLWDLARELPKSSQVFYDDCHLNTEGARAAGHALAVVLRASMSDSLHTSN
jgi:lysophospholipase L1-like esterase